MELYFLLRILIIIVIYLFTVIFSIIWQQYYFDKHGNWWGYGASFVPLFNLWCRWDIYKYCK